MNLSKNQKEKIALGIVITGLVIIIAAIIFNITKSYEDEYYQNKDENKEVNQVEDNNKIEDDIEDGEELDQNNDSQTDENNLENDEKPAENESNGTVDPGTAPDQSASDQ